MRVHIDELVVECLRISPERWNGWAQPVFSSAQKEIVQAECIRLGWWDELEESGEPFANEWHDLGGGEWVTDGWVWDTEEGA
jgi:hypothetical protein